MCFPYAHPPVAAAEPEARDLASEVDFLMWLLSLVVDDAADGAPAVPVAALALA
jgi:hypothetical protein